MQIGTRWTVEEEPPVELPRPVLDAIAGIEGELRTIDTDTSAWKWTLTYLENNPVVELDDGTTIHYDNLTKQVIVTEPTDV